MRLRRRLPLCRARAEELGAPAAAYIETHIEQGPLLEQERTRIGVVTGIQGLRWFNVEVFGDPRMPARRR